MSSRNAWFEQLFRTHAEGLRRYLRRIVKSREAAEDLVQEAFVRVYSTGAERMTSPQGFLFRTAHNLALNHRRDEEFARTDAVPDVDALGAVQAAPSLEDTLYWREELAVLNRVIDSLPPQCRQVFILQKIEWLSHGEIAERLGISISTVEKHISKAIKTCHRHYRERETTFSLPAERRLMRDRHGK